MTAGLDQGATGHYIDAYVFRNRSGHTCTLRGFPGVQYLDGNSRPMGSPAHRGGGFANFPSHGATIVLPPMGRASFDVEGSNFYTGDGGACPTASYIAVYPPGAYRRIVIPARSPVCDEFDVSPVRAYRAQDGG